MMLFVKFYIENTVKNESISVTDFLSNLIDREGAFTIHWDSWNKPESDRLGMIEIRHTDVDQRTTMVGSDIALEMVVRYLSSLRHLKSAQRFTPDGLLFTRNHRVMVLWHAVCMTDSSLKEQDIWDYKINDLLEVWRRMLERKVSFKDASSMS